MMTAAFGLKIISNAWSLALAAPSKTFSATRLDQVLPLLESAEAAARSGYYVALMLSYEAAPAFDTALKTHSLSSFPLAWAAVFPNRCEPENETGGAYRTSKWEPQIDRSEYNASVAKIRDLIIAGDTYQVNYSFPITSIFGGDAFTWYLDLCLAQGAQYCAYLDLGRYQLLSLSPELFFMKNGNLVTTKPMKGTMRRGRWSAEDEQLAASLANSTKDKAENVMIVDLLRNDLGKVSVAGTVRVSELFQLERFETLWQMTSTVESRLKDGVSFAELMGALFPCGSVTGAPKIRTMEIINDLEPFPRGAYTGAIGFLRPGGDCIFNVAIRTLVLDSLSGQATLNVGGGVTIDSTADGEYEECVLKSSFLQQSSDAFELLESILLEAGCYFLLERHLDRLKSSASFFGFPFPGEEILSKLLSISGDQPTGLRKISLLLAKDEQTKIQVESLKTHPSEPRRAALARRPVNCDDRLLFHKTTSRSLYSNELKANPACDDVVLWNKKGEVTESTIANVVVPLDGELLTPPQSSGLLPGTFRGELLAEGKIRERVITVEELRRSTEFFLINSVHKWMKAMLV